MVHGISRLLLCDRGVSNLQLGAKSTIESWGAGKDIWENFFRKCPCPASKDRRRSADDHSGSLKKKIRLGRWFSRRTEIDNSLTFVISTETKSSTNWAIL